MKESQAVVYTPDPAFQSLFNAFTGDADSIGPGFAQPFAKSRVHPDQLFGMREGLLHGAGLAQQPVGQFAGI